MDWQQLKQYLEKDYDFLGRVGANDSSQQKTVDLHPIVRISVSLALRAISCAENGRLAIVLPNRLNCAKWLATLCTLEIIKQDYQRGANVTKFSRGQRLLINKRVVEYLCEEFDPNYNRWYMWIRCNDGSFRIPLDRALEFQIAAPERQLSSFKAVNTAISSAPLLDNPIDGILRIRTLGNKSIFQANSILASRIGDTVDFIKDTRVNGSPIIDLFLWGKLNIEGNVSIIGPQNIKANPCCLVSPDLNGALRYISNNPEVSKGIIIDGARDYSNNLPVLDDILDRKVPVIVVTDMMETEYLQYFSERAFKIWQWNKNNIVQSGGLGGAPKSTFSELDASVHNYCNQHIDIVHCEHPALENIARHAIALDRLIPHDHHNLDRDYGKTIQIINDISRLLRIPTQDWCNGTVQRLQLLWQQFKLQKHWLSDETIRCVDTVFNGLTNFSGKPFNGEKHKPARFQEIVNSKPASCQVAVIVSRADEVEALQQYWREQSGERFGTNIRYLTIPDLLRQDASIAPDHVIVCGWLGRDRMSQLLHSYIASGITMLMYPFESEWFRYATSSWKRQNELNIRAKDFSDIFGLPESDLNIIEHNPQLPAQPPEKEEFSIADFELKLRTYRYQSYASSSGNKEEVVEAKLVIFAGERFSFLTESHRLPVVTEVIREEDYEGEIPRRDVTQLKVGDYVLFQESNRDIIREIADKGLIRNGQSQMRKVAGLWRDVLRQSYLKTSGNISEFVNFMQRAGCKRHAQTIKNWLTDDDQIGPGIMTDLAFIARALSSKELTARLDEVTTAISIVRGAHLQASGYIRKRLLLNLPEIVGAEKASGHATGVVSLSMDEFGQIAILRIEEIGKDWEKIPVNNVNCLLLEEE